MTTMAVNLTDDQADLLKVFADAYEKPAANGQKEDLFFYTAAVVGTEVQHPHLPDGEMGVAIGDLEELVTSGLIRIRYGKTTKQGSFNVTALGFQAVSQLEERELALAEASVVPPEGRRMGLDWQTEVFPVLKAVHDLYPTSPSHKGVSQSAINAALGREPTDEHTSLVLRKLEEAEYILGKVKAMQSQGPIFCEPTSKALELLAGWPTERGDAALSQFMAALESKIEETDDEEEKGKLRTALKSLREVSQGVMVAVISDVLTKGG